MCYEYNGICKKTDNNETNLDTTTLQSAESILDTVNEAMANPDWDSVDFAPVNENAYTTDSYSNTESSATQTIVFPCTFLNSFINFDNFADDIDEAEVEYDTSDPDVAYVITMGGTRIYANGAGTATITIRYGDLEQKINVIVGKAIDEKAMNAFSLASTNSLRSSSSERREAHYRATDMLSYAWETDQRFIKWQKKKTYDDVNKRIYFEANTTYLGLPYTQHGRGDEEHFAAKLALAKKGKLKNFYYAIPFSLSMGDFYGPSYGADCASFVACCWGYPDCQVCVGDFESDDSLTELDSYADLQEGDALYKSGSHIFFVANNFETPPSGSSITSSYVLAIEQTPPITKYSFFTYDDLEDLEYIGISKF